MAYIKYDRPNSVIRILDDTDNVLDTLPIDSDSDAVAAAFNAATLATEPEPDWAAFRQAILTENGYVAATAIALNSPNDIAKVAATYLSDRFTAFETQGNWSEYLQGLLLTMSALEPSQQANLAQEFLALSQRCHLPQSFINAFQEAIMPAAPPEE